MLALLASILFGFASMFAAASDVRRAEPSLWVERVAGCNNPTPVWHVDNDEPCPKGALQCDPPPLLGLTRRVPMKCDISFRPHASVEKPVAYWSSVAQNLPECFTRAVADGPGMRGIAPASCTRLEGRQPAWGAGLPYRITGGILALKSDAGVIVGSGLAIAPNLVLTAKHVLQLNDRDGEQCGVFPTNNPTLTRPIFAVAGHTLNDSGQLSSIAEERGFRLWRQVETPYQIIAESSVCDLDFVVLRVDPIAVKSRDAELSSNLQARTRLEVSEFVRPSRGMPKSGDGLNMLAYTSNAFFPRGLIASRDGQLVGCHVTTPQEACGSAENFVYYNLQTTPGFSGAPVFSDNFEWIAMHQRGLSVLDSRTALSRGEHRDFRRPNRGVRAQKIVESIAKQLNCDDLHKYEFTDDFRAWLKISLFSCE
jgi:hypothetical protein